MVNADLLARYGFLAILVLAVAASSWIFIQDWRYRRQTRKKKREL